MRLMLIAFLTISALNLFSQNSRGLYFNEIRVDDAQKDDIEFIEIIGPVGSALDNIQVLHYAKSGEHQWTFTFPIGSKMPNDTITDAQGDKLGLILLAQAESMLRSGDFLLNDTLDNAKGNMLLLIDSITILDVVAWGKVTEQLPTGTKKSGLSSSSNFISEAPKDKNTDESLNAPNILYDDPGSGWQVLPATPGTINGNQESGTIQLSSSVLPLQLANFSGEFQFNRIVLQWSTFLEEGTESFDVQKCFHENDFTTIGSIPATGFSNTTTEYSFTDHKIGKTKSIYRLRMVDRDGSFSYSPIIYVETPSTNDITVYPTLAFDKINVNNSSPVQNVIIVDQAGQILKKYTLERGVTEININSLSHGKYYIASLEKNRIISAFIKN